MTNTVSAQTTNEIVAEGRNEVVQIVSETTLNVGVLIIGALVSLAGVITIIALRLVHRSIPEWAHRAMIAVTEKAITTLQAFAEKTSTSIDDKIASAIKTAFEKFVEEIANTTDIIVDVEKVNTGSDDKNSNKPPIQ